MCGTKGAPWTEDIVRCGEGLARYVLPATQGMRQIEIEGSSGFCFGVTTAIRKAEEELATGNQLFCLGDIVHIGMECDPVPLQLPEHLHGSDYHQP